MKIVRVDFDDEDMPAAVTVTMSVDEAALVYAHCGGVAPLFVSQVAGDEKWGTANDEVAQCLSGAFFNRFYDNGVHEVLTPFSPEALAAAKQAYKATKT